MNPSGGSDTDQDQLHSVRPVAQQGLTFDALNAAVQTTGSLDADFDANRMLNATDEAKAKRRLLTNEASKARFRLVRFIVVGLLILGSVLFILLHQSTKKNLASQESDIKNRYAVTSLPIADIGSDYPGLSVQGTQTLSINGQLNVNNSLVLMPTAQPKTGLAGQLYYDQTSNKLSYYNGSTFVDLLTGDKLVNSLGGANGSVATGNGLSVTGNTLNNSGVLTIQGQSGNVSLVAGTGIAVNGTTLSNSGLLSLGGQSGDIALGTGLTLSGNTLNAQSGIQSLSAATNNVTVTDLGGGTWSIGVSVSGGGGSGTVASSGGTVGKLAYFAGVQEIEDSLVSQSGGIVTIGGNLSVTGGVTLGAPLTVSNGGTGATSAAGARTSLGAAASGTNSDITSLTGLTTALSVSQGGTGVGVLPTNSVLVGNGTSAFSGITSGSAGQCLVSTAGAPSFQTCPGSGGVASVNSLTGALTIAGVSGGSVTSAGSTITLNDATSAVKGLASFNSADLTVTSGNVDTVQGIATTSTPTFGQLTLTSAQATNDMLVVNNTNTGATGNLLNLKLNGSSKLSVSPAGSVTLSGTVNGQTIGSATNFTGTVAVGSTLTVNTITPTSSLVIGVGTQAFTLQGGATSTIKAVNGANATTIGFQSPTANVTYNFATAVAGSYDVCTTAGNCVGVGGGVTSPGGTTNALAKFTSSNAIGNSIISDNGSTATISGTLAVNTITPTAALTVGATSQNLTLQGAGVTVSDTAGGITNSLVFATPSGSNKTITLPNASGTVAVSASGPISIDAAGNLSCPTCLTSGGGGGSAGVSSLNSATGALTLQGVSAGSITTVGTTITVNDASSSTKGLASFNATNLTVTSGSVNTVQNIAVTATPTFAGLTLSSALTVANGGTGAATAAGARTNLGAAASGANSDITSLAGLTTALSVLQGGTGATGLTANGVLIGNGTSPVSSVTGSNGQCLMVVAGTPAFGTCPGSGSSPVTSLDGLTGALTINNSTGSGSAITINNAAADGTTKGIATFNGTNFKDNGAGVINTIQDIATSASPSFAGLSLGTALSLANGGTGATGASGARTNLGAAASGANSDITSLAGLTTALSVSQGGTGLTGLTANQLLVAGSTTSITQLANGSSGQCLVSNGAGSAPSFQTCTGAGGVSSLDGLTGSITIANSTGSAGTITIANAAADGTTKGIATFNGTNFTASSGVINTIQNINSTATPTFGSITISSTINANTLTPSSSLIVGATTQSFTLQGNASSVITATSGSFATSVGFAGTPTGAVRYNFDQAATPGTYTVCTTVGNCVGAGGAVTTPGGSTNAIAKFTAGQTLGNSGLSDDGTNITTTEKVGIGTTTPSEQLDVTGQIPTSSIGNASTSSTLTYDVAVAGKYAYTASYGDFDTWDITRPTNPIKLGTLALSSGVVNIKVSGKYAFVWNGTTNQVYIINISNPASPSLSATIGSSTTVGTLNQVNAVAVQGRYLYIAASVPGTNYILVYDISSPNSPQYLGNISEAQGVDALAIQGTYLYATLAATGLQIVDISNPASLVNKGSLSTAQVNTVVVQGRYAYLANGTTLQAVNVSNPNSPVSVSTVTLDSSESNMTLQGKYMYVAISTSHELQVVNISNPASMSITGTTAAGTEVRSIALSGNYAYVADYTNGKLLVYDMGGAAIQLLQVGSATASSLDVSGTLQVEGSASFAGGLRVNQGFSVDGNSSIQGALQIQNSSGVSLLNADTVNSQVTLGTASSLAGKLVFYNASNSNSITFQAATSGSGNNILTIPNETGTICTTATIVCSLQTAYTASTGGSNAVPTIKLINSIADINIQDSDTGLGGNFLSLRAKNASGLGNVVFGFAVQGQFFEKPTTDSTTVAQIENASGNTLFAIDSSGGNVNIGSTGGASGGTGTAFNGTTTNIENSPTANTATNIGSIAQSSGTATINIGYTNISGGGSIVNIGSGSGASSGTTTVRANGALTLSGGTFGLTSGNFNVSTAGAVTLAGGQSTDITTATGTTAANMTIQGGTASGASNAGGNVTILGGTAGSGGTNGVVTLGGFSSTSKVEIKSNSVNIAVGSTANAGINIGSSTSNGSTISIGTGNTGASSTTSVTIGSTGLAADAVTMQASGISEKVLGNGITVKSSTTASNAFVIQDATNAAITVSTNNIATGWNAANASLDVAKDSGTGRSINAAGTINASGADYAEYFTQATPGRLSAGDVVCLTGNNTAEPCGAASGSTSLIGVVSSNAGYVGNDIYDAAHPDRTALVGLIGQIKVKVSTANGTIHAGDALTLSGTTGVAVRATQASMTLGTAMEDYSGTETGMVLAYVHIGYYDPVGLQSNGVSQGYVLQQADATLATLTANAATVTNLTVTGTATIATLKVVTTLSTADIAISGHIVTSGATPTVILGATAGTGSTMTISGTDTSGKLTLTLGTGATTGDILDLTFAKAYASAPNVVISAGNGNAAKVQQFVTPIATGFSLNTAAADGLAAGQTYIFYYHVIQ